MRKDILAAAKEMLRVSPMAQLLIEQQQVIAMSPGARTLFPEAEEGASADAVLGPAAEEFHRYSRKGSMLYPVPKSGLDVTLTMYATGVLVTATAVDEGPDRGFIASVSAEITDALTSVTTAAPILYEQLEANGDPKLIERAAMMNRGLYRLLRITRNLSLYAEPDRTMIKNLCQTDLGVWTARQIQRMESLCTEAGRMLRYRRCEASCPCLLDGWLMQRALLHLVSNAIKFSEPGSPIDISLDREGKRLDLTVRDHGSGIPADRLGRLFGRQELTPLREPEWGMGLGLPLTRRIVELHDGRLLLESGSDGLAAHILLPVRATEEMVLRSPVHLWNTGFNTVLVELSEVLPYRVYDPREVE